MKIELKKIYTNDKFSEETICFKADLYCDGKLVGHCENDGRGGCTNYYGIEHHWSEKIKQMEEYCKTLPPIVYQSHLGRENSIDMTLEHYIDDLIEKHLKKKADKSFEKEMEKGILYGTRLQYRIISFLQGGKKIKLSEMFNNERGITHLRETIKKLKSENQTILNTNLPIIVLED